MVEAIEFNSTFHFSFNEGSGTIAVAANTYAYALPADFRGLINKPFYRAASDTGPGKEMVYMSPDELKGSIGSSLGNATYGPVRNYSLHNGQLLIYPVPASDGPIVSYSYVKDIGRPSSVYNGTAWAFKKPDGSAMANDYSNPWFTEGRWLTTYRALYYLWSRVYQGEDQAIANARAAQVNWFEEKARLVKATNKKKGFPSRVRGYL